MKTDPTKETPAPLIEEKRYVMNNGWWVEEEEQRKEQEEALREFMVEVDKIPQIGSLPQVPVDLLKCPFHFKPLTRKKPPDEIEKQEVLFCPEVDCSVFQFAGNLEAYLQALHYTPPSIDVTECWDMLQCYCHFTPVLKLSQSQANHNRLYLSCNNFTKALKCPYFQWFDEPFSNKNAAWQDEMRFIFRKLPIPANREEARKKMKENTEACKRMGYHQYFSGVKADIGEKRKKMMERGNGSPRGGGPRKDGGGGDGPKQTSILYFTRADSSNEWGVSPVISSSSTDGAGTVLF